MMEFILDPSASADDKISELVSTKGVSLPLSISLVVLS
jgi:hypothetical protein